MFDVLCRFRAHSDAVPNQFTPNAIRPLLWGYNRPQTAKERQRLRRLVLSLPFLDDEAKIASMCDRYVSCQSLEEHMPSADDFRSALYSIFSSSQGGYVDVTSGDLHRRVGGYPGTNHAMPNCCSIMRQAMQRGDVIVAEPPKGNGATLTIRYRLPR